MERLLAASLPLGITFTGRKAHIGWIGLFETSVTAMDALRSPSASSNEAAAHDADQKVVAAATEMQGAMKNRATLPYWR